MTSPWWEANVELIRELFGAVSARDRGALEARLADDVIWHTPGRSKLAGEMRGPQGVIDQLAQAAELTNGTLIIDVLDIMGSDHHATVYYRTTAERDGRKLDLEHLALFTIKDGQVTHVDQAPLNLYAYDEFWA